MENVQVSYCQNLECWQLEGQCEQHKPTQDAALSPLFPGLSLPAAMYFPYIEGASDESMVNLAFWDWQLKAVDSEVGCLKVKDFVASGKDACVFRLEDETGKVSNVLKVAFSWGHVTLYTPAKCGAHLISRINHPGICSPTHFFYLTPSSNALSLRLSAGSVCVAMIMPLVEGATLESSVEEIAAKAENVFHFGLLLAKALYELWRHGIQHGDLVARNIIISKQGPVLIDWDHCLKTKTATVAYIDYLRFLEHLSTVLHTSKDIRFGAKKFILDYLNTYCDRSRNFIFPLFPRKVVALMQVCTDHLSQMKPETGVRFDSNYLESEVDKYSEFEPFKKLVGDPRPVKEGNE